MERRWVPVPTEALPAPGTFTPLRLEGRDVLVHNLGGVYHVTGAVCPHQGRSLATGRLEGVEFTCPWHAWVFDVTNGCSPYTPRAKIPCHAVKLEAGVLWVSV